MQTDEKKTLSFGNATLEKLMEVVTIKQVINPDKFRKWFDYKYEINDNEETFLKELIEINIIFLPTYNEKNLIVKFIGPVLNKIKFYTENVKEWYGYKLECELNGYILKGEPDFMLASGLTLPEKAYFFLQEYKRTEHKLPFPEYQVLAGMLTAMTLNKTNLIRGSYLIGRYWNFVILEKLENGNYEYFVSKGFDCLDIDSLKQIYVNLKAVKSMIKEELAGN